MVAEMPKACVSYPPENRDAKTLALLDSLPGLTRHERWAIEEIIRLTWPMQEISGPGGVRSVLASLLRKDMQLKLGKDGT